MVRSDPVTVTAIMLIDQLNASCRLPRIILTPLNSARLNPFVGSKNNNHCFGSLLMQIISMHVIAKNAVNQQHLSSCHWVFGRRFHHTVSMTNLSRLPP